MAKYFLHVKVFSRGKGSRVTRAAAYRAGERIHDDRTSESYDYSDRQDIPHKEIVLPSQLAGRTDVNWARERSALWNAVEQAGQRRNARLAREVLVTLPPELAQAERTELARRCHGSSPTGTGARSTSRYTSRAQGATSAIITRTSS